MQRKELNKRLEIRINSEDLDYVEEQAARLGLTRSQLIRNFIRNGVDDLKLMQRFGLVSLVEFVRIHKIKPNEIMELAKEKQ
jgi:hypothetical protein